MQSWTIFEYRTNNNFQLNSSAMTNRLLTILIFLTLSTCLIAQNKLASKYAKTISEKDLYNHLSILASDSLQGRETGMAGQKMAASYISENFKKIGLLPSSAGSDEKSYYQSFVLQTLDYYQVYLKKGDVVKENFKDFLYYTKGETFGEEIIDVVFVGYGDGDNIETLDVEGKYVAFINKEWSDFRATLAKLKKGKAKGYILIIEDEGQFDFVMSRYGNYLSGTKMGFEFDQNESKILLAGTEMAEWIFEKPMAELKNETNFTKSEIIFNADMHIRSVRSENVLGFLPGTEKPNEILVISAHYDHLGIVNGEIYNGADDDGSGTSTMLELAEAFAKAAKEGNGPKRSILFLAVSGEEKGLLGSEYYSNNPIYPLANTIVDLNIDMVGRVDEKHEKDPNYIYLIGSDKLSTDLHNLSEDVNSKTTKLELDYTYNSEDDPNRYYYRSDHYNFAKNGIPVIFYFNGTHEDYHQPTDTIEKINFKKMKKIGDLVFFTAWEIANREETLKVDKK
jgi:hypothetical protein